MAASDSWTSNYSALASGGTAAPPAAAASDGMPESRRAARLGATANLTKTIVGAGILSLPFGLQDGGAGMGLISLVITGFLSMAGFLAIGYVCHATKAGTYREAWCRSTGLSPVLVDVMICGECLICCVGFVILILDYLGKGLQGLFSVPATPSTRAWLAAVVALSCLIPLSLKQHFHSLRFYSMFGIVAILYTILYVVLECLMWLTAESESWFRCFDAMSFASSDSKGLIRAMCVMTSSYISHYSAPVFYADLGSWSDFREVALRSFGAAMASYIVFAMAGFARFAPNVLGNVLLNYDSNVLVMLAWVIMGAMLAVSFPLQFKPARDTLAQILRLNPTGKSMPGHSFVLLSTVMVGVTVVAGTVFTDISQVLAFRGALLGCPISFLLPGCMLLGCPPSKGGAPPQAFSLLLIAFGAVAGMLGLYCAVV